MAHQINQIFQYQEEKQRSDSWEGPNDDDASTKKKPPGHMSDAELSYLEHKSKLKRTQLQRPGTIQCFHIEQYAYCVFGLRVMILAF